MRDLRFREIKKLIKAVDFIGGLIPRSLSEIHYSSDETGYIYDKDGSTIEIDFSKERSGLYYMTVTDESCGISKSCSLTGGQRLELIHILRKKRG